MATAAEDIRDPSLFDEILTQAGIQVALSGIRVPRMNSVMERWVQTCRRELLDRTLIWNQRHLVHALRDAAGIAQLNASAGLLNPQADPVAVRAVHADIPIALHEGDDPSAVTAVAELCIRWPR